MSNSQPTLSIEDVLGHSRAHEAGEIGLHAGYEAIGKIIQICGNITDDRQARDIAVAIAYGIILSSCDALMRNSDNFRRVVEATRETYNESGRFKS